MPGFRAFPASRHAGLQGGPAGAGPGGIPLSQLDMGSFFETLIPIKSWLHDRGWRQGIRLLIIPYALLPLIFLGLFSTSGNLTTPGWAYSLYIAPLWLLAFWYLIRPPKIGRTGSRDRGRDHHLDDHLAATSSRSTINDHFANTHNILGPLVVGYNEESTKAIPVLVAAICCSSSASRSSTRGPGC